MLALGYRNLPPAVQGDREARYAKYFEDSPLGPPRFFMAHDSESDTFVGMASIFPTQLRVFGELVPAAVAGEFAVDDGHRGLGCFQQDLETVQLIYAHHVLTGTGTFEIQPPTLEEMAARWGGVVQRGWPFVVACPMSDLSRVMGFAFAVQYRNRAAYAHTFEVSVYSAPTTLRRGAGALMLAEVLNTLRADGARQALAFIGDSANAASIGLHRKLGFQQVGTLARVGEKFGRALDVVVMQRSIPPPKP